MSCIRVMGLSGAGKGTQSRRLVRHLGIPHLSTVDMRRKAGWVHVPFGEPVSKLLESGRLVSDQLWGTGLWTMDVARVPVPENGIIREINVFFCYGLEEQ